VTAELAGRTAIVTGAGAGIGRAIALTLAAAGAKVVVNARTETAHETASAIRQGGGEAFAAVADLADRDAAGTLAEAALREWGRIDILCNNAGILDRWEPVARLPPETWDRVIAVNLTAPFLLMRAVLPDMLARRSGTIVNIASEGALRGGAAGPAYTTSKHGLVGLTRNTAWMHAEEGIRCNAVCPGATESRMTTGGGPGDMDPVAFGRIGPVLGLFPHMAEAQRIAGVVLFLASDASRHVNGAIIPVDGGWSAA